MLPLQFVSYREDTYSKNRQKWKTCPKIFVSASGSVQMQEQLIQVLLFFPVVALGDAENISMQREQQVRWDMQVRFNISSWSFHFLVLYLPSTRKTWKLLLNVNSFKDTEKHKKCSSSLNGEFRVSEFFSVCFLTFSFVIVISKVINKTKYYMRHNSVQNKWKIRVIKQFLSRKRKNKN